MDGRVSHFDNDGFTFDVHDEGPAAGPVIIALHGFPQRSSAWTTVTPYLTQAGFRVLAFDQRGYSPKARPAQVGAYTLDRLAGDVLALADTAGAQRFHVLAHDWGASVAWFLASRHGERLLTANIASTPHPRAMLSAFAGTQLFRSWYMWAFQLPWLPERTLRARDGAALRRMLEGSGLSAAAAADSVELFEEPGAATAVLNWYRALRVRGAAGPGRVRVPTMYVWSDGDTALGRRAAEGSAQWVSGPYQFHVLPDVSHWIPEEAPEELARLTLGHIAAHQVD